MVAVEWAGIEPLDGPLDAEVTVPGSKSVTNRALVCAALADGASTLTGALQADDTEAMVGALRALDVEVEADWPSATVVVHGRGGALGGGERTVDARMSGTTARFLAPVLGSGEGRYTLTGHPQLVARPMGTAIDLLRELGVDVTERGAPGHLPIEIAGAGAGGLRGGGVTVPGEVSSQFLSGVLLAAPMLADGLTVEVAGGLVSRPYVELTRTVMASFGAVVRDHHGLDFTAEGHATTAAPRWTGVVVDPTGYRPATFAVEPDASAASYFFAAAAICGGSVRVPGLGIGTVQGDLRFVEVLEAMGCTVVTDDEGTTVSRGDDIELVGGEFDLADFSDTAPTLAVVAAFASTPTRVTGIGFIRRKETDRIAAVVTELRRCGVDAEEEADGFVVRPSAAGPRPARIETYDDHRMAMAFSVLGLKVPGTVILDPGCVAKTFPNFFERLDRLR